MAIAERPVGLTRQRPKSHLTELDERGSMYILAEYATYVAIVGMLGAVLFLGLTAVLVAREGVSWVAEASRQVAHRLLIVVPARLKIAARALQPGTTEHSH